MDNFIILTEENLELRTKIISQLQEILDLKQKLIEEIQDSTRILEEKQDIIDKSIENNKKTIKIIETLLFSLEIMQTVMKRMPVYDPNRKILSDAFEKIKNQEGIYE